MPCESGPALQEPMSAVTHVPAVPCRAARLLLGPEEHYLGHRSDGESAWQGSPCSQWPLASCVSRPSGCRWTSVLGWRRHWTSVSWKRSPVKGRTLRPGGAASPSPLTRDSACWCSARTTSCSRRGGERVPQPPPGLKALVMDANAENLAPVS